MKYLVDDVERLALSCSQAIGSRVMTSNGTSSVNMALRELVHRRRDRVECIQRTLSIALEWAANQRKRGNHVSLPDEKHRSLKYTKDWLSKLKDTSYKPNTGEIRERASRLLKHYPWSYDIEKGFPPRKRDGVKKTFEWLMKLLDRRVKIKLGSLREQAADLLDSWPGDDMIDKALKKWQ